MDKKIKGGDNIPRKSTTATSKESETADRSYIQKVGDQLQRCIGDICFPVDDNGQRIIEVRVDEARDSDCAELIRGIIQNVKEPVRFVLKSENIGYQGEGKTKEQQIAELEKTLKSLRQ